MAPRYGAVVGGDPVRRRPDGGGPARWPVGAVPYIASLRARHRSADPRLAPGPPISARGPGRPLRAGTDVHAVFETRILSAPARASQFFGHRAASARKPHEFRVNLLLKTRRFAVLARTRLYCRNGTLLISASIAPLHPGRHLYRNRGLRDCRMLSRLLTRLRRRGKRDRRR